MHRMIKRSMRLCLAGMALLISGLAAGCGSPGAGPSGAGTSGAATSSAPPSPAGQSGQPTNPPATPEGSSPEGGGSTTLSPTDSGPTLNPGGPDFVLFSLPECSVVPGGSLSGADNLTLFVALRNAGPGDWTTLVPFRLTSPTGLSGGGNTAISTGSAFTGMQVDLRPADWSGTHRFTITADPDNAVVERDESNNTLEIDVTLPPRPSGATDVACSLA